MAGWTCVCFYRRVRGRPEAQGRQDRLQQRLRRVASRVEVNQHTSREGVQVYRPHSIQLGNVALGVASKCLVLLQLRAAHPHSLPGVRWICRACVDIPAGNTCPTAPS